MAGRDRSVATLALWSLVLLGVALARPLFPIDETRYLAVAWESWLRGDVVLLHLNGQLYSHKPPLLFWLIQAGWAVFGVGEGWPDVLMVLIALAGALLTRQLARALAPGRPEFAAVAPLVAASTLLWAVFATGVMFDLLLTACVLLGLIGVVRAADGHLASGFALLGLGIGLGVLAKGPAVLVHLLPVAVLAPLWTRRPTRGWGAWYLGIAGAIALGAAIALAWAIPAAMAGGERFGKELFWGQSANRMAQSFAHRRPFWWYLPALPFVLAPWLFWGRLWRGARALWRDRRPRRDRGGTRPVAAAPGSAAGTGPGCDRLLRFAGVWAIAAFAMFSAISGKQLHYLLPELPAFGLLAAAALAAAPADGRRPRLVPLVFAVIAAGIAVAAWRGGFGGYPIPPQARPALLSAAGLVLVCAVGAWYAGGGAKAPAAIGTAQIGLVAAGFAILLAAGGSAFDVKPVSTHLAALQDAQRPIAHLGKYHGQFHFAGRLVRPIEVLQEGDVPGWCKRYPDGVVIAYSRRAPLPGARFSQALRTRYVSVLPAGVAARTDFEAGSAPEPSDEE
jgi:4-amino-4-deoxy-L-arabinose transferase-like glycosyltransferase